MRNGRHLRFAVGAADGARGLVWSASVRGDEAYVGTRGSPWKVSLHASGVWRIAFTEECARKNLPDGQDRVVARWNRPAEIAAGLTHGLTIAVPYEALAVGAVPERRKVVWCRAPSPGEIAWFGIMEGQPRGTIRLTEAAIAQGITLVGELRLGDRPVGVTHSVATQSEAERTIIAEIMRGEAEGDSLAWWPTGQEATAEAGRRLLTYGETRSPHGSRHLFEMWVPEGWTRASALSR